jgi:ADP-ribosylglycohydrolase
MSAHPSTTAFADQARAALLTHSRGDRFGAPLELLSDRSVRTREVRLDNWIDDTQMPLYLGEAILPMVHSRS